MKQTLRILMLLAVAVLTAGQVWAENSSRVSFVYAEAHGTAVATEADGKVTITITPVEGWRSIDGDVTAVATVANSSLAESRRAEGGQEDVSIELGEAIEVSCAETNKFTLTLPTDVNKKVLVTVKFSARLDFTPTVSIEGWTYGETANAPTVGESNTSGGAVTYTYSDTQDGTYTADVPTAAGTYYVKATIAATADYNAAVATTSFTIAAKTVTIGASGWATYYHEDNMTYSVSDGAKVYYVSGIGNGVVNLTAIDGIPAELPVLISGSGTVTLTEAETPITKPADANGQFHGTATEITATDFTDFTDGRTYVLYGGKFLLAETNSGISAHKCWLTLSGSNARQLNISIGDTNSMYNVPCTMYHSDGALYDLKGRKIDGQPTKHGIYLYNGKKVIK